MTREEAKLLIPIIQDYVNGRTIQWYNAQKKWVDIELPTFFYGYKYRVKPAEYEYFTHQVFPNLIYRFVKGKSEGAYFDGQHSYWANATRNVPSTTSFWKQISREQARRKYPKAFKKR